MPTPPPPAGFTLVELLVVIGIIAIVMGIVLAVVSGSRRAASGVVCAANLRQVHAAFAQYLTDNNGVYPDTSASGLSWEQLLRVYAPGAASTFRCTADAELFPAIGSSYDWRDTGRADTTLAGRNRADRLRSDAVLAFDALPGWHARDRMNAVRVDGSAASMDANECLTDLQLPVRVPDAAAATSSTMGALKTK